MLRTTASTAVVANDRGSQAAAAHPRPAPATMARGPLKGDAPMTDSLTAQVSAMEEFLRSSDGKVKPLRDTPGLADVRRRNGK